MTIYEAVEKIPMLRNASPSVKTRTVSYARLKKIKNGEILFREREKVESLYFIAAGFVVLYRHNHQGDRKNVFVCGKGELLNEVILEQPVASISGQTLSECWILSIPRSGFLEMLGDADFSAAVLCSEAGKIRRLYRQLSNTTNMSHLDIRICAKLWKMGKDFGEACPEGLVVPFELSITFLADMVGAKRESVSRVVKILKEEGLIDIRRGQFVILDMQKMLERAHK